MRGAYADVLSRLDAVSNPGLKGQGMGETSQRTLVFILGPPAVGKATVGRCLSEITGFPLFHNHVSIEAVLPVFPHGSESFGRLVGGFRREVFREAAQSDLPGLIFTYVWAFDSPGDLAFVNEVKAIFEAEGGRTVFAELWAALPTRLERNAESSRQAEKASKRDVVASRKRLLEMEELHTLDSAGAFPLPDHVWIDNTSLEAADAARRIAQHFGL